MQRNWLIAAIVVGVIAIIIAALAMRLSDDGSQTTQQWADGVCASLSDWRTPIASRPQIAYSPSCQSLQAES